MTNPVRGPLRILADAQRRELGHSREASFRIARVLLRALGQAGFVVRRDQDAAEEDVRRLEDDRLVEAAIAEAELAGPASCTVRLEPGSAVRYRLEQARGHTWTWKLSGLECRHCGPLLGRGAPEGPLRDAIDLERVVDAALDIRDALQAHRPDLAREDVAFLLECLGQPEGP